MRISGQTQQILLIPPPQNSEAVQPEFGRIASQMVSQPIYSAIFDSRICCACPFLEENVQNFRKILHTSW